MLLCWQASETLTVSVLAIGDVQGFAEAAARAVEAVWAAQA